ncbi:MAG: hypothetical protein ACLU9S_00255 [Oscillospiraceae bacterium]
MTDSSADSDRRAGAGAGVEVLPLSFTIEGKTTVQLPRQPGDVRQGRSTACCGRARWPPPPP